jgi:arsenite methyltransferase
MDFTGDMGLWQRRVAECPGGVAQRMAVLETLSLETGHSVIDVGCGGGHLVREFALAVGTQGHAVGLDISEDQVDAAKHYCAKFETVDCIVGDITNLTFETSSFDNLASIRTLEYVADVLAALSEIRRILKPGGGAAIVSVLWDQFRFHGPPTRLNDKILDAFRAHCPHQMLPLTLRHMLAKSGFGGVVQKPITLFETSFNENSYAFWVSKIVAGFAIGQGIESEDAKLWLDQLRQADKNGRFGFVSVPVLTMASTRS